MAVMAPSRANLTALTLGMRVSHRCRLCDSPPCRSSREPGFGSLARRYASSDRSSLQDAGKPHPSPRLHAEQPAALATTPVATKRASSSNGKYGGGRTADTGPPESCAGASRRHLLCATAPIPGPTALTTREPRTALRCPPEQPAYGSRDPDSCSPAPDAGDTRSDPRKRLISWRTTQQCRPITGLSVAFSLPRQNSKDGLGGACAWQASSSTGCGTANPGWQRKTIVALQLFSSGMLTARSFADKNRYEIDVDRELAAFGAPNMASALSQGFAVTGADSRTAMADSAGGRTQVTGAVTLRDLRLELEARGLRLGLAGRKMEISEWIRGAGLYTEEMGTAHVPDPAPGARGVPRVDRGGADGAESE